MNINAKEILDIISFPFSGSCWLRKLSIAWVFIFLPATLAVNMVYYDYSSSLVLILITILLSSFTCGFILQAAHNEITGEKDKILPEWTNNAIIFFSIGIKYVFVYLTYFLPLAIFLIVLNVWNSYHATSSTLQDAIIFMTAIILVSFFSIVLPFATVLYAKRYSFLDAFKLNNVVKPIFKNLIKYLSAWGATVTIWTALIFFKSTFYTDLVGLVIMSFLGLYIGLITLNLYAKTYKDYI